MNFFTLLDPDLTQIVVDLNQERKYQYIKQGTDLWHQQSKRKSY